MESPGTDRKRMRAESSLSNGEMGENSEPQKTPAPELNLSDQAETFEPSSSEGTTHALKKSRFALGSPENPMLLGYLEDELTNPSSGENCFELLQIMDEENGVPSIEKFTVIQSDEDMENEVAAVTMQKSVSQRMKKKGAAEEATQRRSSPHISK